MLYDAFKEMALKIYPKMPDKTGEAFPTKALEIFHLSSSQT